MTKGWRIPARTKIRGVVCILLFLMGLTAAHSGIIEVSAIEVKGKMGETTITLEFTEAVNYRSFTLANPPRLVLDIPGVTLKEPRTIEVNNEVIETIKYLQYQPDAVRIIVNLTQPAEIRVRKAGKKLLLYFSLPREIKARLQTEERAKSRAEREMKTKLISEERARIKREEEEARRLARVREAELKVKKEEERRLEAERAAERRKEESLKRAEEKAKQLLEQRVKGETELKAKEAVAERKLAEEASLRDAKERRRNIEAYMKRGEKYYRGNHFDEAIREFEAVLALDPGNGDAQNYISLAREGKGEERRRQESKRREEEKERKIVEYLSKGKEYCIQGRHAEAISEAEKVLTLSPGNRQAEELIIRSKREALEVDKKKAQAEREIVEGRRTLDVTRAVYTAPVDYKDTINPEKRATGKEKNELEEPGSGEDGVTELEEEATSIPVTMEFKDTDLREVIFYLSKLSGLTIAIDERALAELDDPGVSIYIPTESPMPLTEALNLILDAKGLDYIFKKHYILVAEKGAGEEEVTKAYKLKYGIRKIRAVTLEVPEDVE